MVEADRKLIWHFVQFVDEDLRRQHIIPNETDYENQLSRFLGNRSALVLAFIKLIEGLGPDDWYKIYQTIITADGKKSRETAKRVDQQYLQSLCDGPNAARKFALLCQADLGLYPANRWDPRNWYLRHLAHQAAYAAGRAVIEIHDHEFLPDYFIKYFPDKYGQPLDVPKLYYMTILQKP